MVWLEKPAPLDATLNRTLPVLPDPGSVIVVVTPAGNALITVRLTEPVNPLREIERFVVPFPPPGIVSEVGFALMPRVIGGAALLIVTDCSTDATPVPDALIRMVCPEKSAPLLDTLKRTLPLFPVPGSTIVVVTPLGSADITVSVTAPVNPVRVIETFAVPFAPPAIVRLLGETLISIPAGGASLLITTLRSTEATPVPEARIRIERLLKFSPLFDTLKRTVPVFPVPGSEIVVVTPLGRAESTVSSTKPV